MNLSLKKGVIRLLLAGKIKMIGLLIGMMAFGGSMAWWSDQPEPAGEAAALQAEVSPAKAGEAEDNESRMERAYQSLEEDEAETAAALCEREEALREEDEAGQAEVRSLREALYGIRLQKRVLRARLDEDGRKTEANAEGMFDT